MGSLGLEAHLSPGLRGRSSVTGHLPEPGFFNHEAENITTLSAPGPAQGRDEDRTLKFSGITGAQ